MKITYLIFVFLLVMLLVACKEESTAYQLHEISEDNVFKGYATPIEKAQGIEQTLQDAANMRSQEYEKQGL